MAEPRELTTEEVRERFLAHVRFLVNFWATTEDRRGCAERLSGLAFSILAALDGSAGALPGFVVAPAPHADDAEFYRRNGTDWYPSGPEHDIAGSLHELFYVEGWRPGAPASQEGEP